MSIGQRIIYHRINSDRRFTGTVLRISEGWLTVQPDHKPGIHYVPTDPALTVIEEAP